MCTEVVFVVKLLMLLLFLFAIAGVCEFIYILKMLFYFPKTRVKHYSLVVLKSGYAIKQLNYIWQKIKWYGDSFALGIIAVVDDIDKKEFSECEDFIRQKNIVLCNWASIISREHL